MTALAQNLFSETGGLNWSPKTSYHYAKAFGNQPFESVCVTKTPKTRWEVWNPVLPWDYLYKFPFYFDQMLPLKVAEAKGLTPTITFDQEVDKAGEEKTKNVQKMCIVNRFEKQQYYLLDNEIHPLFVDLFNKAGAGMRFIMNYSLKTIDMLEILKNYPAGNYQVVASKKIKQELHAEFVRKGLDQLNGSDNKCLPEIVEKVKTTLNAEFRKKGFLLEDIVEEFFFPYAKTQELINKRLDKAMNDIDNVMVENTATAKANAAKTTGAAETEVLVNRAREIGKVDTNVFNTMVNTVASYVEKIRGKKDVTKIAISENISKVKGTVALGNVFDNDRDGLDALETTNLLKFMNKKGGQNAN